MTDDDPSKVFSTAKTDKGFEKICNDLCWVTLQLEFAEQESRLLFAKTVDEKFIDVWRAYKSTFAKPIAAMYLGFELDAELPQERFELDFENADQDGREAASGIHQALNLAKEQIEQEWRDFSEEYCEKVEQGISQWHHLIKGVGFDLRGVFRRRLLVPFVLIPRHISNKIGEREKLSLYSLLQQAHESFVYGAPYAAIALMRAIMEGILRDNYKAGEIETSLKDRIKSVHGLPKSVSKTQLHALRQLANKILHAEPITDVLSPTLEREIVEHLYMLRDLIEGSRPGASVTKFRSRT